MLRLGCRGGDGGGTHAGLVRENTAGNTELDGQHDAGADETAGGCSAGERVGEDGGNCGRYAVCHKYQCGDAAADVNDNHQRYERCGDLADALNAAQDGSANGEEDDHAGHIGADAKRVVHAGGDGVALREVANAEGREDGEQGKRGGEEFAEAAADTSLQVLVRAALLLALLVGGAEAHTQVGLGVLRRHADDAGEPDPKQCTRATDGDRGGHTDDVAGAHRRRQRGGQCLVVGDVARALFSLIDERMTRRPTQRAELDTAQPDSEEQTSAQQQRNEDERPPNDGRDSAQNVVEGGSHAEE